MSCAVMGCTAEPEFPVQVNHPLDVAGDVVEVGVCGAHMGELREGLPWAYLPNGTMVLGRELAALELLEVRSWETSYDVRTSHPEPRGYLALTCSVFGNDEVERDLNLLVPQRLIQEIIRIYS